MEIFLQSFVFHLSKLFLPFIYFYRNQHRMQNRERCNILACLQYFHPLSARDLSWTLAKFFEKLPAASWSNFNFEARNTSNFMLYLVHYWFYHSFGMNTFSNYQLFKIFRGSSSKYLMCYYFLRVDNIPLCFSNFRCSVVSCLVYAHLLVCPACLFSSNSSLLQSDVWCSSGLDGPSNRLCHCAEPRCRSIYR